MKQTTTDFIKDMVTIELIEDSNKYGHYPFQLLAETKDGNIEVGALLLGGDVEAVYRIAGKYIRDDARKLYFSLDFPKAGDIEHDFVAVFSFTKTEKERIIDLIAIPYNPQTGEVYERITESSMLDKIKGQFKLVAFGLGTVNLN